MSQTTYSNEEMKHLFQTLYDEKKRNKELLSKLQEHQILSSSNSTQKSNAAAVKQLNDEKAELVDENSALQQQVSTLKKQIEKLHQDHKKADPRHAELLHDSLERQNALEYELKRKIEELDFVKNSQVPNSISELQSEEIKKLQEALSRAKEENIELGVAQSEVVQIKQALACAIQDFKELTVNYQTALKERSDTTLKTKQYLGQVETQRQEILRLQNYMSKERGVKEQLQKEIHQLKEISAKSENIEVELTQTKQQIDTLNSELDSERRTRREIDEELDKAQHHLAKKVKEHALLDHKHEEIQQSLMEAHKTLTENKMTIAELQNSLEQSRQQESRLNEQLKEASKAAETQIARSEEKILALTQKLQAFENRVNELEKIEEKQTRLQAILSDVATLFPSGKSLEIAEPKRNEPVVKEEKHDKEKHFSDLFEMPKTAQKHRRSLLD